MQQGLIPDIGERFLRPELNLVAIQPAGDERIEPCSRCRLHVLRESGTCRCRLPDSRGTSREIG
jgi:hypothetical protein